MSILEFILFMGLTLGTTILFDYLNRKIIITNGKTWKSIFILTLSLVGYALTLSIMLYILSLFIQI